MKFRIAYIGKTNHLKELKAAAQEINPTARSQWLGLVFPDDAIEAEVGSVEEGKALMKHIYQKVDCFPKYYCYLEDKDKDWWSPDYKTFYGHHVHADRYDRKAKPRDYAYDVEEEHFEDFLEA